MAIEYRNGKPYYYRKVRKGERVISKYVAGGALAHLVAELDQQERFIKENNKAVEREEQAIQEQIEEEIQFLEQITHELFTRLAIDNGYHKPKRQWRKKRQSKEK